MDVTDGSEMCERVIAEIATAVIADQNFLENVLFGVLTAGHVLVEDVPGTGKTLTGRSVAETLGLSFSRIQFTPDLLPTDVTGTHVYDEHEQRFEFREGPIFANVVLADEINRAPPKTQSALLEAMEERQVTVQGETRPLPDPFFVIATQNPIEMEGTFELPEAQRDRFLVKTAIGYPERDGEVELLRQRTDRRNATPTVDQVVDRKQLEELQALPESVYVEADLFEYMVDIVRTTRRDRRVAVGVSPRGTQRLLETSRAVAVTEGRDFVKPDDIKRVAEPVLAHRLVLAPDAAVNEMEPMDIVDDALRDVEVPTVGRRQ